MTPEPAHHSKTSVTPQPTEVSMGHLNLPNCLQL